MNQLGKYQLVAEIARGGTGVVYLAVAQGQAGQSRLLVVKELKPELVANATFLDMFLEEARLAARLSHPNIVHTYEVGAQKGRHYITMEYLDGVPLSRILRKRRPTFTLAMHLRVICEVLRGLHYAHTLTDFDGTPLGIVHRDLTPKNVFVTYDGQVKLVDFGIAKAVDTSIHTRPGVLKGKPAYMAPEQIAGDFDQRADVFSAGVMLWEAAAGRRMWEKKGDVEIMTGVLKGQLPSLREAAPETPAELVRITSRALAQREERYQSADELRVDIEAYLATSGGNVYMPEVSRLVAEIFADERAKTRAQIDLYISALKARKEEEALPSLRFPAARPQRPLLPRADHAPRAADRAPGARRPRGASAFSLLPSSNKVWLAAAGVLVAIGLTVVGILIGSRLHGAPEAPSAPPPTAYPSPRR